MKKMIVVLAMVLMMTGCRTVSEHQSYAERHRIESMMQKMDSVMSKSSTTVQDTSWHETIIKELQSIKERNDTSREVVVDSTGKVIRETIKIIREREVEKESDRKEREGMMHRLEKMDSVTEVNNVLIKQIESMMQELQETTVIEKKNPWYLQIWSSIKAGLAGVAVFLLLIGIGLALTKRWWKKIIKG